MGISMLHLASAARAYQTLRDRVIALESDIDERTLLDTLEGLSDLPEIVSAVVRGALYDEALAAGLNDHIHVLQSRLGRLNERASGRRRVARDALIEAAIKKVVAPDFTLSLRPGSPALVVVDESSIPSAYWESREPRLNRQSVLTDLKQGLTIEGACLSTPEPVLSVRVR